MRKQNVLFVFMYNKGLECYRGDIHNIWQGKTEIHTPPYTILDSCLSRSKDYFKERKASGSDKQQEGE